MIALVDYIPIRRKNLATPCRARSPSTTARSISNRASIRRTTSKFPNFWSLTSFATCARRSCCRIQQTPGGHCRARLAGKPRPRTTAGRQTTRRRFASRFPAWPLLLRRLGWHEPHVGSGDGFADRLSVSHVVLLPFDVKLHVSWRHQSEGTVALDELRATEAEPDLAKVRLKIASVENTLKELLELANKAKTTK